MFTYKYIELPSHEPIAELFSSDVKSLIVGTPYYKVFQIQLNFLKVSGFLYTFCLIVAVHTNRNFTVIHVLNTSNKYLKTRLEALITELR